MKTLRCKFCDTVLNHIFVDLGKSPMVSSYLKPQDLQKMEPFYPLCVYVCNECFLVQLPEAQTPEEIFGDYPYFSSYSESWLKHAKTFTDYVIDRFRFDPGSQIVEIASNDGYLLQYFNQNGMNILGVEPARNVAKVAQEAGIPTIPKFFGVNTAQEIVTEGKRADLIVGNNVLAHVPNINDFVKGMKILLKPNGIISLEFPYLMNLILENQFDTIFHEHFSYLSFITVSHIATAHGLAIFDVEELPTHGGSLRIFLKHSDNQNNPATERVKALEDREVRAGFNTMEVYSSFSRRVQETKHKLLKYLIQVKSDGHSIAGYGAPGKGCVLLNYCGIRSDFIDYTVDRNPHKQGYCMPGVHIPIYHPDKIKQTKPNFLLILPWNLKFEIMEQMAFIREWGGQFITPIPEVKVYP